MDWVERLYAETRELWIRHKCPSEGYEIFYSPVVIHPKVALIGYNPGGKADDFSEDISGPPAEHRYFKYHYRLADNVRYIFGEAGKTDILKQSVKFNLIFFRSRRADLMRNKAFISFSKQKVKEIIEKLRPEYIVTEGFRTFDELIKLMGGTDGEEITSRGKKIIKTGEVPRGILMIGLIHPSGAHGISREDLKMMGIHLGKLIKE